MPQQFLTVSEVARRMGAVPRDISDLSYARQLRDDLCPVIGGRRLIPVSYVSVIRAAGGCGQGGGALPAGGGKVSGGLAAGASRSQQPRLAAGTGAAGRQRPAAAVVKG